MSDACLTLPHHILVRKNVGDAAKHGLCLYVKNSLKFVEIVVEVPNILVILLEDYSLKFINVYHPPSNSAVGNKILATFLFEFCLGRNIILAGDFNLPSI